MKKQPQVLPAKTVTTSEAARIVGCKPVTIRQWVRRGKLVPAVKIGRYMAFYLSAVQLLASHFEPKK
jgi:excisionase family DNA binding protein